MLYRTIFKILSSKQVMCGAMLCYAGIASGHDGVQGTISGKANPPVNFYLALMLAVAFGYGVYLLWRAKRKSRAEDIEEHHS